ncbi:MAG TPA: iron ABC transporter permease [Croceibacterium sp.]
MTRANLLLLLALAVAVPLSLLAGRVWLDPWATPNAAVILGELRLPRALLAVAIGGGLGAAGAAMQGYLRNPLADPGLFGIAPGAALGAVLSLLLGLASGWWLPLFALAGAAGAMGLLALIAGRAGGIALFTLAGMMIASLAGALTSLAISLAPNAFATSEIVVWLMGALTDRGWPDVALAAPPTLAGIALLRLAAGRGLDALTLGEVAARSLGVSPARLQALVVAGVGLTVGSGVAVAGVIGFVGLMVPHLVRPLTDRRPSSLIVPSALAGALLVLLADCVCRILPLATELRLGIALSLLGAPFFLHLLLKMRREVA